jgi:methionine salvage enolase-phosphatase E1
MNEAIEKAPGELREKLMRYRILEQETTDPLAIGFLRDIVTELEASLEAGLFAGTLAPQQNEN